MTSPLVGVDPRSDTRSEGIGGPLTKGHATAVTPAGKKEFDKRLPHTEP
ncbi:hypothetical protein [Streptomyces exfoliatus]